MSIRNYKKIVTLSAPAITALGLHHIFDKKYSGQGHILMFHRVIPGQNRPRIHNHESLEITPEQLEQTILFFKKRNYIFLPIQALETYLKGGQRRKFVIFTFDDGYLDNLQYAYPIFKKYSIPFTIYVTSNFINRSAVLWWYLLEETLLQKTSLDFTWHKSKYHFICESTSQKENTFEEIRKLITGELDPSQYLTQLEAILQVNKNELHEFTSKNCLDWQQVADLAKDPIVTIGAHTANHLPLKKLSEEELFNEIMQSKMEIENHIGQKVDHFAYPFGKKLEADQREYDYVRKHNFATAVTTNIGNIFSEHLNHLHKLPRINVNALTTEDVLELQVSGMVSFFKNGKSKVVQ